MNNEPQDLIETSGQITPKAFWYKCIPQDPAVPFNATVIAQTSTFASASIRQQFPSHEYEYVGFSEIIMQVNG